MRSFLVIAQGLTFVGLGLYLICEGNWKLGVAQWLLAGVTVLVYA